MTAGTLIREFNCLLCIISFNISLCFFFFNTHDSALINAHLLSNVYLLKLYVTRCQSALLSGVLLPPQVWKIDLFSELGSC